MGLLLGCDNKPPPTRVFWPQYNKKCTDLQQAKCDELEAQGVLVDPKLHGIPVLHVSPSWIQQKGKAKHKSLQDCTLDNLRFITAFNSLNDSIRPKPTKSCSANTIFKFLAGWQFHIWERENFYIYIYYYIKSIIYEYLIKILNSNSSKMQYLLTRIFWRQHLLVVYLLK